MNVNEALRGIAGFLVLVSVALGYFLHPAFFLFTAFVGANLVQSAFTKTWALSKRARTRATVSSPTAARLGSA